jgi:hypothetical protein
MTNVTWTVSHKCSAPEYDLVVKYRVVGAVR